MISHSRKYRLKGTYGVHGVCRVSCTVYSVIRTNGQICFGRFYLNKWPKFPCEWIVTCVGWWMRRVSFAVVSRFSSFSSLCVCVYVSVWTVATERIGWRPTLQLEATRRRSTTFAALGHHASSCPIRRKCHCIFTVGYCHAAPGDSKPVTTLYPVSYFPFSPSCLHIQYNVFYLVYFETDFGITTGEQISSMPCGFHYNSTAASNGTFWSPNFPGFYPRDTECHYFFHGQVGERVKILFTYFDIEGMIPWVHFS